MNGAAPLFAALRTLRAPLIAALVFVSFVAIPNQSLEIYAAASENLKASAWVITMSLLSVVLLCVAVNYCCEFLIAAGGASGSEGPAKFFTIVLSLAPAL